MMKKRSVVLGLVTILLATTAVGCSSGSSTSGSNNSNSSAKKENGITMDQFNKINLDENSGTSLDDLKKELGKPSSTSTSTVQTQTVDLNTWSKGLGNSLAVGFSNGHAISKHINGLKVNRKNKITLDSFGQVQNGQSEDDVKKMLGDPNGINTSTIAGTTITILTYTSGLKGSLGSNATVTITNGAVSGESQSGLE
ncbi:DUF3862 domain-containing protein [Companilactobacillus musae]|uniref:DUF3862 domain-containing protein n=1 Tax=Companilactobacillus musae TaxID=1903258 RepID=UPI000E64A494|nr:DUF3862 domain-containing protein [Companilactobacillus musae]HCD07628.1 hypothetical protein [Lactobacillus sp.]